MKKLISISLIILLSSNTPAQAGKFDLVRVIGEFVIQKVDAVFNEALGLAENLYKRVTKNPSENLSKSSTSEGNIDTLNTSKKQSCGDLCEYIVVSGGNRAFRIIERNKNRQSSCSDGFERRRLKNPIDTLIYTRPQEDDKPLGYYKKREVICTKVGQPKIASETSPARNAWYQSENGWFLDAKVDEKVLSEYVLNGIKIRSLELNDANCGNEESFLVEVNKWISVVYLEPSEIGEAKGFYNRGDIVCVMEERITNYPETWYQTKYGWNKKMHFIRLTE